MRTVKPRARIAVVAAGCLAASVLGAASATAADEPRPVDRRPAGPRPDPRPVDPRPVDPKPVDPGVEHPRPDPRPGHPRYPEPRHPKPRPGHGIVVVNGLPMDAAPDRPAHTGCMFQVDFHGYGRGPRVAKVVFRTVKELAPGGRRVLLADRVLLGERHPRSPRLGPLSASRTYTLDMSRVHAGPKDRVPVVLTVVAPGSAGSDVKRAVYWVSGCAGVLPGPRPVEPVPVPPKPVPVVKPAVNPPVKPVPAPPVTDCVEATTGSGVCTTVVVSPSFTG